MGVQGLWELLAPVGRRVSVETLAGKKLAIDASIWMVQFMKAMRDEKGEMLHNAHVLGFFRRICKLLFLRVRPVFVFDGGTPAIKRRTIAARRRNRENARARIRKTAEKLLINHLKQKRLEELAEEIKHSHQKEVPISKGKQVKSTSKGKEVVQDGDSRLEESSENRHRDIQGVDVVDSDQGKLDELLAASLAAEEQSFASKESVLVSADNSDEEADGLASGELTYSVMNSGIDPTVLASLPPSMQLDLLVQMRERLMAENRKKYQKVKKAPSKFSQLQIESYLKTVAFRREIDEVQKCAMGRGIGGIQTSKIASESNREFIFSSSFTGDKQKLASTGIGKSVDVDSQILSNRSPLMPAKYNSKFSNSVETASVSESFEDIDSDVGAYYDGRGNVRVSRVRGLGMRMTRDLQHNLHLMKEFEQTGTSRHISVVPEPCHSVTNNSSPMFAANEETNSFIHGKNDIMSQSARTASNQLSQDGCQDAIEISFLEDYKRKDVDDDFFLNLVSGRSKSPHSDELILEEGMVEVRPSTWNSDVPNEKRSPLTPPMVLEDDDVDWEEGSCHVSDVDNDGQDLQKKIVSVGRTEEEADIQEAVKRSLEDIGKKKISAVPSDQILHSSSYGECMVEGGPSTWKSDASNEKLSPLASPMLLVDDNDDWEEGFCHVFKVDEDGQEVQKKSFSAGVTGEEADIQEAIKRSLNDFGKKNISAVSSDDQILHSSSYEKKLQSLGASTDHKLASCIPLKTSYNSRSEIRGEFEQLDHISTSNLYSSHINKEDHYDRVPLECETMEGPQNSSPSHGAQPVPVDGSIGAVDVSNNLAALASSSFAQTSQKHAADTDKGMERDTRLKNNISDSAGSAFIHDAVLQETFGTEEPSSTFYDEISHLQQERVGLGNERRKLESNAESVSSEMFVECQELLQMFGLPYIVAPMEAEAQCAFMEMEDLVDGVITDDSDVFLFGARSVFKNIFDDRKYVETYFMKDIESEMGLSRDCLIRMALLLGSDYTEGISGVGIVNALEIVHAFPEDDGLHKFREWMESPDPSILGKFDSCTINKMKKKTTLKNNNNEMDNNNGMDDTAAHENQYYGRENDQPASGDISESKDIFMTKHRNVSKNWHIPSNFPSDFVVSAYISPQVDESHESFSWGKPDLFLLRKLCWERFGWNNQKADELLVPVLKEYEKHETQLRLEAFYTFNERFAKIRSQRIKKALKGMAVASPLELADHLVEKGSKSKSKEIAEKCKSKKSCNKSGKNITSPLRRQKLEMEKMQINDGAEKCSASNRDERDAKSGFNLPSRERRGRGRGTGGRGRGRSRGIGKTEQKPDPTESSEADSIDSDDSADVAEELARLQKDDSKLRRSSRQRKHIDYGEESMDIDDNHLSSISLHKTEFSESTEQLASKSSGTPDSVHPIDQRNPCLVGESCSKDYFASGGGFCVDESDDLDDAVQPSTSDTIETTGKRAMFGDFSRQDIDNNSFQEKCPPDSPSLTSVPHQMQVIEVSPLVTGLRAMKSLKRKKRKV